MHESERGEFDGRFLIKCGAEPSALRRSDFILVRRRSLESNKLNVTLLTTPPKLTKMRILRFDLHASVVRASGWTAFSQDAIRWCRARFGVRSAQSVFKFSEIGKR